MARTRKFRRLSFGIFVSLTLSMAAATAQQADLPVPEKRGAYMPTHVPRPPSKDVPNPLTIPGPPPVQNTLDVRQTKEIGGPFSLVDHNGNKVTEKDYDKYYKLIFFGYTNCPSACPMALTKISQALAILGDKADKVKVLFITTDPKRDTPEVMKKYLANFKSDKIVGLTGTSDDIKKTESEFRIYAEGVDDPRFPSYTVNHSTIIYFTGFGTDLLQVMNTADSPAIMAGLMKQHLRAIKTAKP
jgi:cytochrome oxidase Cu insertion factor (SCO1/SenC/PrrC family)